MNPFAFDNAQMLQDSVTPEATSSIQQIPGITKIAEPVTVTVKYQSTRPYMPCKVFERSFTSLQKALAFIELKASSKGSYNHFELEIL